jgi:hypothetical protein
MLQDLAGGLDFIIREPVGNANWWRFWVSGHTGDLQPKDKASAHLPTVYRLHERGDQTAFNYLTVAGWPCPLLQQQVCPTIVLSLCPIVVFDTLSIASKWAGTGLQPTGVVLTADVYEPSSSQTSAQCSA